MITFKNIRTAVQDHYKLNINITTRRAPYVVARTIYFKLCKELTGQPLSSIGHTLNKNHATVLHAIRIIFESWVFCNTQEHLSIYSHLYQSLTEQDKLPQKIKTDPNEIIRNYQRLRIKLLNEKASKRRKKALEKYYNLNY